MYHGKWQLEYFRIATRPLYRRYDLVVYLAILAVKGCGQIVGQYDMKRVRVLSGQPVDARGAIARAEHI